MFSVSHSHNQQLRSQQQGAALVLALIVVAIVVLLASSLASDFLVTFKRVENQLHGHQAAAYLRGAEGLARRVLQADLAAGPDVDHRSEGWLNQTQEFPMAQGAIIGTLCDYQARFNVNNLATKATGTQQYSSDQQFFIRLLQALTLDEPLDQATAEDITHAVIDWLDDDDIISSTGGAEDGYYSDLPIPLRPANQPLHNISELRWVKGISNEIYRALAPHIVALETGTLLNINTATVILLRALNENNQLQPLTESDALEILLSRDGEVDEGYTQQKMGFKNLAEVSAAYSSALVTDNLVLKSNYFLLETQALFLGRQFSLQSILHRQADKKITTIARGTSGFGTCITDKP